MLSLVNEIAQFELTEKEQDVAAYMVSSTSYTDMLENLSASHERQKKIARTELEVALAAIQTQMEFFERDWEERWVRKVKGMARNVLKGMGERSEVPPEEQGSNLP